jgi:hypothetical protein
MSARRTIPSRVFIATPLSDWMGTVAAVAVIAATQRQQRRKLTHVTDFMAVNFPSQLL